MTTLWLLPSHTEGSAFVGLGRASWSFCTLSVKTVQGTLKSLNFRFLNLFTTVKVCGTSRPSVIKEEPHCCSRGQPFLTEAPSSLIGHHHHCIPPLWSTETLTRPQACFSTDQASFWDKARGHTQKEGKKMLGFGGTQQTILGTIEFLFRVCISPSFYLACCNNFLNEVPTPPAPAPFQKFITTWRSWAVVQVYSTRVSESGSPDEHI